MATNMFYIIYRTINLINGKFYIGKHQTKNLNDGYMGSGKLLQRAIKKYGAENFVTEILEIYDNEHHMNLAEKILVVIDPMSYNLCSGGKGGFGYINENKLYEKGRILANSLEARRKKAETLKGRKNDRLSKWTKEHGNGMLGKKHSEETKKRMSGPRGKYNVNKFGIKRGPYKKKMLYSSID